MNPLLQINLPYQFITIAPGKDLINSCAQALVQFIDTLRKENKSDIADISSCKVIVPAYAIATELRRAFVSIYPEALLLPKFLTFEEFVANEKISEDTSPLSTSERQLLLYEALRAQKWFDEGSLWEITAEMCGLFDELTTYSAKLPDSEEALAKQLEEAYALRASIPLAFEARVIHETWRALSSNGRPDEIGIYHLKLAQLAKESTTPLFVLLDAPPEISLTPAERDFLTLYAKKSPLMLVTPNTRHETTDPLMQTLSQAWPENNELSLFERSCILKEIIKESPLSNHFQLVSCEGAEKEAQAIVAQIAQWLNEGLRHIALIAQDRLTARRVRALLERENILLVDETGWKLSTSRAAAFIDALIESVSSRMYFKDLLDLFKSPFIFADILENERKEARFITEQVIRKTSIRSGLDKIRHELASDKIQSPETLDLTNSLLARIDEASSTLRGRATTIANWLDRLAKALDILGASTSLMEDSAGRILINLIYKKREELRESHSVFSLESWRDWFNRELESIYFKDDSIKSPIVLTSLQAAALRQFEAVLLMGGDAEHMSCAPRSTFFNSAVRRELGLPSQQELEARQKHELSLLLSLSPSVTLTWQREKNGEANQLAPAFALLSTLHKLAWNDDLIRTPLPTRQEKAVSLETKPDRVRLSNPTVPKEKLPNRISVSAYTTLVSCPYRFFARHVLGLMEMDEVTEVMAKSDYGALVHKTLERFHRRCPELLLMTEEKSLAILNDCVSEVFNEAIEENFRSVAWQIRWQKKLAAYISWQREQEKQGWHYAFSETGFSASVLLETGEHVEIYGRIDRLDKRVSNTQTMTEEYRLIDYKTQTALAIKGKLKDDIQLPVYALLQGKATQAAYVSLDGDNIETLSSTDSAESLQALAHAQENRLAYIFNELGKGAGMPAHGAESACKWCEMNGLCRKDYVE